MDQLNGAVAFRQLLAKLRGFLLETGDGGRPAVLHGEEASGEFGRKIRGNRLAQALPPLDPGSGLFERGGVFDQRGNDFQFVDPVHRVSSSYRT